LTSSILCVGLYKPGSVVESSFTHRTVDPDFTVMLTGSNPFLLIRIVLSDTLFGRVGDTDPVVWIAGGVTVVVCVAVSVGVAAGCTGAGWVQPQTSIRSTAAVKITILFFIKRSLKPPVIKSCPVSSRYRIFPGWKKSG